MESPSRELIERLAAAERERDEWRELYREVCGTTAGNGAAYLRGGPEQRLWARTNFGECWVWLGYTNPCGYGRFHVAEPEPHLELVHRWAYEHYIGPIPEGFTLDHLCRNPPCWRPDHLEPVTPEENSRRAGEARTVCSEGHPLVLENLVKWHWEKRHVKVCRICTNAQAKLKYLEIKYSDNA